MKKMNKVVMTSVCLACSLLGTMAYAQGSGVNLNLYANDDVGAMTVNSIATSNVSGDIVVANNAPNGSGKGYLVKSGDTSHGKANPLVAPGINSSNAGVGLVIFPQSKGSLFGASSTAKGEFDLAYVASVTVNSKPVTVEGKLHVTVNQGDSGLVVSAPTSYAQGTAVGYDKDGHKQEYVAACNAYANVTTLSGGNQYNPSTITINCYNEG